MAGNKQVFISGSQYDKAIRNDLMDSGPFGSTEDIAHDAGIIVASHSQCDCRRVMIKDAKSSSDNETNERAWPTAGGSLSPVMMQF